MGKYKYLIKNVGLLTLSNFATKLLSFFLVPLYTNILTTGEYGTYDLFNTTIGVLLPILTLNIQDATIRFALDKKYKRDSIVTISFRYLFLSNLVVAILLFVLNILKISPTISKYGIFFFLMFFVQSVTGIVTNYTRGIDKIADLSVTSVICSTVTISLNVIFLVVFKWRLIGYFLANIIGPLVQCIILMFKEHMFNNFHVLKGYSNEHREMITYSIPLIANSLAWWVNNASDRYVVVFFCGIAANGIYSVASKIPSILNVFQTIFGQAWSLSAVRDFDPKDEGGFFANTYKAYNCVLTIICSLIILSDKILAKYLYAKNFFAAWVYVPWLTMAILFGALAGYIGGFFTAVKDSKAYANSTIVGAIINIALNLLFTPIIGPLGAAIATTISFAIVWMVRYVQSKKYIKININIKRDIISYLLLILQSIILMLLKNNAYLYISEIIVFIVLLLLYLKDISLIFYKIAHK